MSRIGAMKSLLSGMSTPPAGFGPRPVPLNPSLPYVTCVEVGGHDMCNLIGRNGLAQKLMQFECWHSDYDLAWDMRKAIKNFLCPFGGLGYKGVAGDLVIAGINHAGDREFYDGIRELHQVIVTFEVWWEDDVSAGRVTVISFEGAGSGFVVGPADTETVTGSGSGLELNILEVGVDGEIIDYVITNPGSGYAVNDTGNILCNGIGLNEPFQVMVIS